MHQTRQTLIYLQRLQGWLRHSDLSSDEEHARSLFARTVIVDSKRSEQKLCSTYCGALDTICILRFSCLRLSGVVVREGWGLKSDTVGEAGVLKCLSANRPRATSRPGTPNRRITN
jgi:hypothetical protein